MRGQRTTLKILKHIIGLLLATFSVVFLLGGLSSFGSREPEELSWPMVALLLVMGLLFLAGAIVLLRQRANEIPASACPRCGGTQSAPAGLLVRTRHYWLHQFGGWLLASLWGASRQQQVRCVQCDTLYFKETRGTRIAGICLWVLFLLLLLAVLAGYLGEE